MKGEILLTEDEKKRDAKKEFTLGYKPEESVDGKIKKFTIKKNGDG